MASALDTARSGIEARLSASIASLNLTTDAVAWPGVEFDPGEDDWIRPTLVFGASQMESYGSGGVNTVEGLLLLDVFTVTKHGLGDLYDRVDALRDLFDRATVGSVVFGAASGPREIADPQWRQLQIEVPFIIEENS